MPRSIIAAGLVFLTALTLGAPGCTFGEEGGPEDAGQDAQDAGQDGDGGGDQARTYPPGPYGHGLFETVENLSLEILDCDADPPTFRPWRLEEYLDAKATMLTVHTCWCTVCKQQSETLEGDIQRPYGPQGLRLAMIMFQDEVLPPLSNTDRQSLIDCFCPEKELYGLTCDLLIDPSDDPGNPAPVMSQFFQPTQAGTPLNMLLDDDMVIRYKIEGLIPDSRILQGNIEGLLSE